jgi:hypothetical protein
MAKLGAPYRLWCGNFVGRIAVDELPARLIDQTGVGGR